MKIAVVGASGFVGTALVERLIAQGRHEVRPLIHSSGNAWGLARLGLELRSVDLLSKDDVRTGLAGCTHVVNCSRGSDEVMIQGLRNLLQACQALGVERFVQLSSVAVYGDPPPADAVHEEARARPDPGTYGWIKLQQDDLVLAACRRGLPCVVLCPPNISGAQSFFLLSVLSAIRECELVLVDGGRTACNLVDVQNLAKAITQALVCEQADGSRIFVTDDEETTWLDLAEALMPLADGRIVLPTMSSAHARSMQMSKGKPRLSVVNTARHLGSGSVRRVLRQDPLLEKLDHSVRSAVGILPKAAQDRLRMWINGPVHVPKVRDDPSYDTRLCAMQLRGVRHSCAKAKRILGYTPDYHFAESMEVFRSWYEATHGCGSHAVLLKEL